MVTIPTECDVLVIGSGASGLAAAVTAAHHGLKVLVIEKEPVFGGTTAWAGGYMWIPGSPLAKRLGMDEDPELPRQYLKAELGNRYNVEKIDSYLENGPRMLAFLELHSRMRFADGSAMPDMQGHLAGASVGGRAIRPESYDGRELGPLLHRLRPPKPELTVFGIALAPGADLRHFMNASRSLRSALYVARRFIRQGWDMVTHGRSTRLANGNAMVARLACSLVDLDTPILLDTSAERLLAENGRVVGAVLRHAGQHITVHASRAVVLAGGGFMNDPDRRRGLFSHAPTGHEHWTAAPLSNTGDGLRLGEGVGGWVNGSLASPAGMTPVSLVPRKDGSFGHFPHSIDRAKPGLIAVTRNGKRFVNEAGGYHHFVEAMIAAAGNKAEAWLICDHKFQRRYGLGNARPAPFPVGPHIRSGYLKSAKSIAALARLCGICPEGLVATVEAFNRHARRGEDPEFGRGSTPYNRFGGDPANKPNPCVAPIEHGTFYAVRVVPGSFSTFAGLETDAKARVLNREGEPIAGLFAVGNDMASVFGGFYPAGGINLGPAMTFGFVAGMAIAREAGSEALDGARNQQESKT
jgi:succinate dehydrogenase/fumarate reductase flavoprotein subunit